VPDIVLGGTITGRDFFEASNSITSTSNLQLSEGTKVQMRGGVEVRLLPGFTAWETTSFRAMSGPCGGGGVTAFNENDPMGESMNTGQPVRKVLIHLEPGQSSIVTQINVKEAGMVQLVIKDEAGTDLHYFPSESLQKGTHSRNFSFPAGLNFSAETYYLHALLNGEIQHFQELSKPG
jgi:hypothetical protein